MRTETDLHAAFALLEREGDDYLAAAHAPTSAEPPHELVPDPPRPARRRRILLPVLAAAAAASTGLAVLAVGGGGSAHTGAGGPAATPVCVTPLPAAWQAALSARTVTVEGTGASAEAISTDGTIVVSWLGPDNSLRIGTVREGTTVTEVYRQPAADRVWHIAANSHYASLTIGRHSDEVDDIVLVDLATGVATGLLADAPPGATPWDPKQPILQDGTLYWLGDRDHASTLYSYDIASRTYGTTPVDLADFHWRAVGFGWHGGSIPAEGLPPVHPPLNDLRVTEARDDQALAWSYYDAAATLHWSDRSGTARDLEQHLMQFLSVEAVAGPYVFLDREEGSDSDKVGGDVQVLDTRTGAMADTGDDRWMADRSAGGVVTLSPMAGDSIRILDTNGLPGLTC